MLRFLTSATALALAAAAGTVTLQAPTHAAAVDKRAAATPYALSAFSIGTAVTGGDLPASSGRTAYRIIGCTNRAPVERENHVAEATVPGLGDVSGVKTRVWTTARNGVVGSNSVHSVAKVLIGKGSDVGTLEINAVKTVTRAWHDAKGFHADWAVDIGDIIFRPAGGPVEVHHAPAPGETLLIPELASIKLGSHSRHKNADGARAYATALKIHVIPSDSRVRVAHTSAKIGGGVKSALFRGHSNATRVEALDGNLTSGPNPLLQMPCQGTDGKVVTSSNAELDLAGQIVVRAANTRQMGKQTNRGASGFEEASIAEASLGGGQLVIQGIVARANVVREGSQVRSNVKGTSIDSITANGEPQEIPDPGETITIPGLAELHGRIVDKIGAGVSVTALRVKLLDGTGAVIDLGQADLEIINSGRR